VTFDCVMRDIDECNTENGGCPKNALCMNHNGVLDDLGYKCVCKPGYHGDGTSDCLPDVYKTRFRLSGSSVENLDVESFVAQLISLGVLPPGSYTGRVSVYVSKMYY
jgi:hypothetical protein